MRDLRAIGYAIRKRAEERKIDFNRIADRIGVSVNTLNMVMAGRMALSYPQLKEIAACLDSEVSDLVNDTSYDNSDAYIDCMVGFKNLDNREHVIDLIYDYLDILDEVMEAGKEGIL